MWVVADLDDDYIAKMEDGLELYERVYDIRQPVICLDQKPITLHADLRPVRPAAPGREARRDKRILASRDCQRFLRSRAESGKTFHLSYTRSFGL